MRIVLNYRHKNERLEGALQELGHSVAYNLWDIHEICAHGADAAVFEFKQILKEEAKFLNLSHKLKKAGIPRATWCLDMPNIGARRWKLSLLLKANLIDIFATHSLQELPGSSAAILYLPNAAWLSRYNMRGLTMDDLRDTDIYTTDVSFIGNIDSAKHPEHRHRTDFLNALGELLKKNRINYRFEDGRFLDFDAQIELIQKSKININFGCAADRDGERSWGLPERCYGIPACGGFLLSDERLHGRDDFVEGDEIVMFNSLDECMQKIIYYIKADTERRRIAENAHKRVLNEHTYKHRAEKLTTTICGLKKYRLN